MDKNNWVYLSRAQVVDAVANDFEQYGSQPALYERLFNLLPDTDCRTCLHENSPLFHIQTGYRAGDLECSAGQAGFFLIHLLETLDLPLPLLADMAGQVFETRVVTDILSDGVWVCHGMAGFSCAQCGACCRHLAYTGDCSAKDIHLWQVTRREDILSRVRQTGPETWEIWVDHATGQRFSICPWLETRSGIQVCTIHDAKPGVCRQYPFTAKHAAMTGCLGRFNLAMDPAVSMA